MFPGLAPVLSGESALSFSNHLIFPSLIVFPACVSQAGSWSRDCFFTVLNVSLAITCPGLLRMKPCWRVCPLVSSGFGGGALKSSISRIMAGARTGFYSLLMLGVCYQNRQFFLSTGTLLVDVTLSKDSWKSPCRVRSLYSHFSSFRSPFSCKGERMQQINNHFLLGQRVNQPEAVAKKYRWSICLYLTQRG